MKLALLLLPAVLAAQSVAFPGPGGITYTGPITPVQGNSACNSVLSIPSLTFSSGVALHHLIMVAINGANPSGLSGLTVTDTFGTTFIDAGHGIYSGFNASFGSIWYGLAAGSGTDTVSVTPNPYCIAVNEFAFVSSTVDVSAFTASSGSPISASVTTTAFPDLLYVAAFDSNSNTFTASGGWTIATQSSVGTSIATGSDIGNTATTYTESVALTSTGGVTQLIAIVAMKSP